ncbi:MAG TPA: HAD hydrolase family protein [Candidatus Acidoferrales bacterium]|nr:HAD hydrolase family protein [Candidatus Acidoferrales bacterium]
MRYFALACDYDGTIAHEGVVAPTTVEALQRLKESGRRAILVTGRELDELLQVFPDFSIFDRIVADNGAVLYSPATRETKVLAEPPPPDFIKALRQRGIPFSVGRVIIGTVEPYDSAVLELIKDQGLELQVIYNKGSVMVLPSGVNKSTGLTAALDELALSPHNAVAVGDAENDHALLNLCEMAVAVANAIPTLIDRADFTTSLPDGAGVEQLIDRILRDDLAGLEPRRSDPELVLGKHEQSGAEVCINPCGESFIIAGPSGSGKTTVVRALIERLVRNGYQICLIDPEGDYDEIEKFIALGSPARPPKTSEILQLLQSPRNNVSVNLLGVPLTDRPAYFSALFPKLFELRSRTGRPHWVIIDEAHHLIPKSWDPVVGSLPEKLPETILVTVQADSVHPAALKSMTGIIAVGASPEHTIRQFSSAIGFPSPNSDSLPHQKGTVFLWRVGAANGLIPVKIDPPSEEIRRHKRKYAGGELPPDRSFYFKGPDDRLNLRAQNLRMFIQLAQGVDEETWIHHLRHRDYSTWMRENIKDDDLVAEVSEIENAPADAPAETRSRVIEAINKRYTKSE